LYLITPSFFLSFFIWGRKAQSCGFWHDDEERKKGRGKATIIYESNNLFTWLTWHSIIAEIKLPSRLLLKFIFAKCVLRLPLDVLGLGSVVLSK
jgi:hypothetical protein